ncbi:hypothetical protein NDU88_001661 [Pleurodeles waltl]|uniref:Uncharacterized protein n=1 Tax=Pleurodeles waltl TaxID=8319 RepID=A0AAV7TIC5_PLEWA|nr:hypothetical protein NDU88_001661 [Pleurodeles waltl]
MRPIPGGERRGKPPSAEARSSSRGPPQQPPLPTPGAEGGTSRQSFPADPWVRLGFSACPGQDGNSWRLTTPPAAERQLTRLSASSWSTGGRGEQRANTPSATSSPIRGGRSLGPVPPTRVGSLRGGLPWNVPRRPCRAAQDGPHRHGRQLLHGPHLRSICAASRSSANSS